MSKSNMWMQANSSNTEPILNQIKKARYTRLHDMLGIRTCQANHERATSLLTDREDTHNGETVVFL